MIKVTLNEYPIRKTEIIRYRDTDRQGHVNNAVYVTFIESARTDLLYDPIRKLLEPGCEVVIAKLEVNYLKELHWPGEILIGTKIGKIGTSSVLIEHGIFQGDNCAAEASTAIVMINSSSRKPIPFSASTIKKFETMVR